MAAEDPFPDPLVVREAMLSARAETRTADAARLAELVVEAEQDRAATWEALAALCRKTGLDAEAFVAEARQRGDGDVPPQ